MLIYSNTPISYSYFCLNYIIYHQVQSALKAASAGLRIQTSSLCPSVTWSCFNLQLPFSEVSSMEYPQCVDFNGCWATHYILCYGVWTRDHPLHWALNTASHGIGLQASGPSIEEPCLRTQWSFPFKSSYWQSYLTLISDLSIKAEADDARAKKMNFID